MFVVAMPMSFAPVVDSRLPMSFAPERDSRSTSCLEVV
jgi:hypothetical protein